jgi:hypothetical protein
MMLPYFNDEAYNVNITVDCSTNSSQKIALSLSVVKIFDQVWGNSKPGTGMAILKYDIPSL